MLAHPVLLQKKYVRILLLFAEQKQCSLYEALDFFYRSETYQFIREGISNMHCMSDEYLAEDLCREYDGTSWICNPPSVSETDS